MERNDRPYPLDALTGSAEMTDYAELLATKSAELAELTRAFNQHRYEDAADLSLKLRRDFAELASIALDSRGL